MLAAIQDRDTSLEFVLAQLSVVLIMFLSYLIVIQDTLIRYLILRKFLMRSYLSIIVAYAYIVIEFLGTYLYEYLSSSN